MVRRSTRRAFRCVSLMATAAFCTVATPALAQGQAQGDGLEEITVTARKHLASERLMEENRKHEDLSEKIEFALKESREELAEAAVARQLDIEAQYDRFPRLRERRDQLLALARFSTTAGGGLRSLEAYAADLKPNQTEIYYLVGESAERIRSNPKLEAARARGHAPLCELAGYGTTSDAKDPVRPDLEGASSAIGMFPARWKRPSRLLPGAGRSNRRSKTMS